MLVVQRAGVWIKRRNLRGRKRVWSDTFNTHGWLEGGVEHVGGAGRGGRLRGGDREASGYGVRVTCFRVEERWGGCVVLLTSFALCFVFFIREGVWLRRSSREVVVVVIVVVIGATCRPLLPVTFFPPWSVFIIREVLRRIRLG